MKHFFGIFLLTALFAAAVQAQTKPNIILIYADDLGWGDVGFNGRSEWKTPNLDRLARQGTIFKRFYTPAVVCAPSRFALMTGKHGIHNGASGNDADLPAREVTIPEALKPLGYTSAIFGKWHQGKPRGTQTKPVHPLEQGFDEFAGHVDAGDAWNHFPKELWYGRERKAAPNEYSAKIFSDLAIDFVRRHREKPFFLYLPYIEPHLKIEAPAEDIAKFRGKFAETDPDKPLNATYAAMIERLDAEIGRLLKEIDRQGLSENTIIVFSSDHGATFEPLNLGTSAYHDSNRPFRGQKRTVWEGGIRVPGVVRWTGKIPAGKISNDPVQTIDLLPTFLAAAGGEPKAEWKIGGRNLLPVWTAKEKMPERTIFFEYRSEGYFQLAAMRGNYKFIITDEDLFRRLLGAGTVGGNVVRAGELYDVENDPAERRSLAFSQTEKANGLQKELLDWIATETEESKINRRPVNARQP